LRYIAWRIAGMKQAHAPRLARLLAQRRRRIAYRSCVAGCHASSHVPLVTLFHYTTCPFSLLHYHSCLQPSQPPHSLYHSTITVSILHTHYTLRPWEYHTSACMAICTTSYNGSLLCCPTTFLLPPPSGHWSPKAFCSRIYFPLYLPRSYLSGMPDRTIPRRYTTTAALPYRL